MEPLAGGIPHIGGARATRDFANSGSIISEIAADARFRLVAKRGRCAISPISEIAACGRFHSVGNVSIGRCAISLIWETLSGRDRSNVGAVADARFHMAGKRN